ncbi:MAG: TrkH family potassium uptake protein, partial [bacterium]|nr:TrkH family potassium uptake protein [bacterium]
MRFASVINIQGMLLMFLSAAMLLPIPFSLYYKERDWVVFVISAAVTLVVGATLFLATRYGRDLRTKEGFAVVSFGWIFLSIFGSLPFLLSGAIPSVTDAFFETMSGFTTTGATILT